MPLPTPNENESEQDFIPRCMGDETANADFPKQEQRAAVCYRQWRERKTMDSTEATEVSMDTTDEKALSLERLQNRVYDAWRAYYPSHIVETVPMPRESYIHEMFDEYVIVSTESGYWKVAYTDDGESVTFAPRDEWQKVKEERNWIDAKNTLKAISQTADELRVANYIVLFGGRDLEGIASPAVNLDGSKGEYFTPDTDLESHYTKSGVIFVDWEHGRENEPGPGDVLGIVDWKTAKQDERGVWVERVLNRRSKYVKWLEGLIAEGVIGSSSEAVPDETEKAQDGAILRWPLRRDTLTVQPMEPRMMTENYIQAFKALGLSVPNDTMAEPEHEPETAPEVEPDKASAAAVAKAKARCQQILLSLMEE